MEKLLRIAAQVFRIPVEKVDLEMDKENLEAWDSLAHLHLIANIEEEFDISIPMEDIPNIHILADFLQYIKE